MERFIIFSRIMIVFILFSFKSFAVDIVKIKHQQLSKTKDAHNFEVVQQALKITEPEYGAFSLEKVNLNMTSNRELRVVDEGEIINVTITPANELWDKSIIPIKVPIRMGLLSYRLLLVNKIDLPTFAKIKTLEELKQLTVGLLNGWKTTGIFKSHGIKMVETHNYKGMFLMLNKHRFDYIPRTIYEIDDELKVQQSILKDIVIEPTIALVVPSETYVYVSPKNPRLAERLAVGLHRLLTSGKLKEILIKYYAKDIERANLKGRTLIKIENDYFNQKDNIYKEHFFLAH